MKKLQKTMLMASLLAVGFAGFASAAGPFTVRVTGSSAYRAAVLNSIIRLLDPSLGIEGVYYSQGTAAGTDASPAPSSFSAANQQVIHGFLVADVTATGSETTYHKGDEFYFQTSWSGSISGLVTIAGASSGATVPQNYMSISNINTSDTTQLSLAAGAGTSSSGGPTGGELVASPAVDPAEGADIAMTDVFPISAGYGSASITSAADGLSGANQGGAPSNCVGVVPFLFVTGADFPAPATGTGNTGYWNINSNQAQDLFTDGLYLGEIINSTSTTPIHTVGRDADSGTRFTTFAETAFSPVGGKAGTPTQYQVGLTGSTITSVSTYPNETINGKNYNNGAGGYSSGSSLQSALGFPGSTTASGSPGQLIGYVGESDANHAVTDSGKAGYPMTYNGVAYATVGTGGSGNGKTLTFNRSLIDNGVYTLWGYEHEYYVKGDVFGSIADKIANNLASQDAAITGELLKNMQVSRTVEGGVITSNN